MHFPSKVLFLHLVKLWRGAPAGGIFFVLPCNYPYSATIIRPQNTTLAKASPHFIHALVKGGRKIYLRKLFLKENSQICRGERFINIKTDQTDHDQQTKNSFTPKNQSFCRVVVSLSCLCIRDGLGYKYRTKSGLSGSCCLVPELFVVKMKEFNKTDLPESFWLLFAVRL